MYYHLAQINVALLREPLDSPLLADFVAQLDPVNAVADLAPGFVWRWVGNTAEKKELLNMSVWTGVDELFSYTYRADHVEVFRNRLKWFEAPTATPLALWWIPAGHIPTPEEGYARLAWIREYGPGPFAFSFKQRFPAFLEPEAPEEGTSEIVWDGRTLVSAGNTPNSDVDAETTFHYRQEGRRVWATYEGGGVRFGSLVARADSAGRLDMRYQHANEAGELRQGRCHSIPQLVDGGKLRVDEQWQWLEGSTGRSVLLEAEAERPEFAIL